MTQWDFVRTVGERSWRRLKGSAGSPLDNTLFIWLPVSAIGIPLAGSNSMLRSLWLVLPAKAVGSCRLLHCHLFKSLYLWHPCHSLVIGGLRRRSLQRSWLLPSGQRYSFLCLTDSFYPALVGASFYPGKRTAAIPMSPETYFTQGRVSR